MDDLPRKSPAETAPSPHHLVTSNGDAPTRAPPSLAGAAAPAAAAAPVKSPPQVVLITEDGHVSPRILPSNGSVEIPKGEDPAVEDPIENHTLEDQPSELLEHQQKLHHLTRHWLKPEARGDCALHSLGATTSKEAEHMIK